MYICVCLLDTLRLRLMLGLYIQIVAYDAINTLPN